MKFTTRPELKLALTLLFIIAVYFQSISHPFSHFDDPFIVEYYGTNSALSFLDVITPGGGFYYRPLITLSYWLDFRLWGLDPTFMHLENIIVHLANVLLVFLIASRLPVSSKIRSLPYLGALIFGLHPINSEPVNWVAGRTDVFAGMFVLLAIYCLIWSLEEQLTYLAVLAYGVALVGILTKETAIMIIPAALLVTICWPVVSQNVAQHKTWRLRFILVSIVTSSCFVSLLFLLVYVKRRGDNALSLIIEGGNDVIMRSFEAFGFYVKKTFMPLPLNIAIVEVNPLYVIVGITFLLVLIVTFRSMGIPGILLATAVLFTLPALIVATISIAWTPYGERYLYIPSAFAVLGSLELFHRLLTRLNAVNWFVPVVSIIIVIASIVTIQRGMLWGNNLAMVEDVVAKSPQFGVARNEYGILLKQAGRYDEAERQFRIAAEQNNQANVDRMIRLNLIGMKILGKPQDEVRRILMSEIGNKADGDEELLKIINRIEENMLVKAVSSESRKKIVTDIIETNEKLYQKTHEPHYLYRSGQLALSIGNTQNAAVFFRKAWENAQPDAYYREPARKLAEKLTDK